MAARGRRQDHKLSPEGEEDVPSIGVDCGFVGQDSGHCLLTIIMKDDYVLTYVATVLDTKDVTEYSVAGMVGWMVVGVQARALAR